MRGKYNSKKNIILPLDLLIVKSSQKELQIEKRNTEKMRNHIKQLLDSKREITPYIIKSNNSTKSSDNSINYDYRSARVFEKLAKITERLNEPFIKPPISKCTTEYNNNSSTNLPEIKNCKPVNLKSKAKIKKRWSDVGLNIFAESNNIDENENFIKTFNLDGIHYEVSAKKGKLDSYSPDMNLIHYDFARGISPMPEPDHFPKPVEKLPIIIRKPVVEIREKTPPIMPLQNHCIFQ